MSEDPPPDPSWPPEETSPALPDELSSLVERAAASVHDSWARHRLLEGWRYGQHMDHANKLTPQLVPYDQLPEAEKQLDRGTVETVLRHLLSQGYRIERDDAADAESPPADPIPDFSRLAEEPVAALYQLWQNRNREQWRGRSAWYLRLSRLCLDRGAYLLAQNVASRGLSEMADPATPSTGDESTRGELQVVLARSLLEVCAFPAARQVFGQLKQTPHWTPDIQGMFARTFKESAFQANHEDERERLFKASLDAYLHGWEDARARRRGESDENARALAIYNGVNAAFILRQLGRRDESEELARSVQRLCAQTSGSSTDYWTAATQGETALLTGDADGARRFYADALACPAIKHRERVSIARQAQRLLGDAFQEDEWTRLFQMDTYVVVAQPDMVARQFTPESAAALAAQLDGLRSKGDAASHLYACWSRADEAWLFDALLQRGWNLSLLMLRPFDCRSSTRETPELGEARRRLLAGSVINREYVEPYHLPLPPREFMATFLEGWADMEAHSNLATPHRCVFEPDDNGEPVGNALRDFWNERSQGPIERIEGPMGAPANEKTGWRPFEAADGFHMRPMAMMFADVKCYSRLNPTQLRRFYRKFLPAVAETLAPFQELIVARKTWGDGIFLLFDDLEAAPNAVLAMRDQVAGEDWKKQGFPDDFGLRTSLDAGPVYLVHDPISGRDEVAGRFVNRAARIEPVTPTGMVYSTAAFAYWVRAHGIHGYQFSYAGEEPLPKGFGETAIFALERAT